jgi:hypothetical protein
LELESRYNLLDWKIEGVYAWQSARIIIYLMIVNSFFLRKNNPKKLTLNEKIKCLAHRIFINSVFCNPFLDLKKHTALVFDSGRKYKVDNGYLDIYTDYFCTDLKNEGISFRKYETNYSVDNLANSDVRNRHLDFILLTSKIISIFIKVNLEERDIKQIKSIEKSISTVLKVDLNLSNILKVAVKCFRAEYPLYKLLFRMQRPEEIYLTNSSDKASLIKAAKDCKIIVNELQHGLMVKEDLISNYPNSVEGSVSYFPDKFYKWDGLEMCTCKLPISEENIIKFSNRHLHYMLQKTKNNKRNVKQILVISQPECSGDILQFIMRNIDEMKDFQFIYKIHPAENLETLIRNEKYKLDSYKNIKFISNEKSIYQIFSESAYVIGIFSTALFEAYYFGCKILILDLPGAEFANSLLDDNKAKLLSIDEKLFSRIE